MLSSNSANSASANARAQQQYAQARALQEQANWVKAASALRTEDIQRNINMTIGRQVAAAGGAGVRQEGSIISNAASSAAQGARDLFNEKFQTDANVANLQTGANNATAAGNSIQDQAALTNNLRLINFLGGTGLSLAGAGLSGLSESGSYTGAGGGWSTGTDGYGERGAPRYGGPR
jgi:hypothetical protein